MPFFLSRLPQMLIPVMLSQTAVSEIRVITNMELDQITAAGVDEKHFSGGAVLAGNSSAVLENHGELRITDQAQSHLSGINAVNSTMSMVVGAVNVISDEAGIRGDAEMIQENDFLQVMNRMSSISNYVKTDENRIDHTENSEDYITQLQQLESSEIIENQLEYAEYEKIEDMAFSESERSEINMDFLGASLSTVSSSDEGRFNEEIHSQITSPLEVSDVLAEFIVLDSSTIENREVYLLELGGSTQSSVSALNIVNSTGSVVANGVNVSHSVGATTGNHQSNFITQYR